MQDKTDNLIDSLNREADDATADDDARMSPATLGWMLGSLALVALSVWIYLPTLRDGWTRYDNTQLILGEPKIRDLSVDGLKDIFTNYHHDLYQPLLTLSLATDYKLFGRDAATHAGAPFPPTDLTGWHIHSLALHCVTVILFFLLIGRMTGNVLASWLGAALVALHPLLVEPVSWLICRTFLLAGFWIVLGCHFYLSYARRPRWWLLLFSMFCFGLSMMAKLHVGIFLIPVLIDLWCGRRRWLSLLVENLPLAAMVGVMVWVNSVRMFGNARIEPLPEMAAAEILHRAMIGLAWTAANTFYPRDLSVFYGPVEEPWNLLLSRAWIGGIAVAAVLIATIVALVRGRVQLLVCALGWGALFAPMLAAIRVRETVTSDRYNYVALWMAGLGVAWILKHWFGSPDEPTTLGEARLASKRPAAVVPVAVLLALGGWLAIQSRAYARVWSDDVSVWEAVVHRTPHRTAYGQLANALISKVRAPGKENDFGVVEALLTRAEQSLQAGIEWEALHDQLVGNKGLLHENYGVLCLTWADRLQKQRDALQRTGDIDGAADAASKSQDRIRQAEQKYRQATEKRSGSPSAWNGLGVALMRQGNLENAREALTHALELAPGYGNARTNLLSVLRRLRYGAETAAARDPGPETGEVLQAALLAEADYLELSGRQSEAELLRARADAAMSSPADAGDPVTDLARVETSLLSAAALAERGQRLMLQLRSPSLSEEQSQHMQSVIAQASAEMNAQAQTAEAICRAILAEDETSSGAWSGLAQALMYQGRMDDAREAFSQAVAQNPNDAEALAGWGRLLAATGDSTAAADVLQRALNIEPNLEQALLDLSKIRVGLQEYDAATTLMEKLYQMWPDNPLYKNILKQLYQQLGRNEEAAAIQ